MRSRFEHLRTEAISLRKEGNSIRDIELKLGIPRSTLSGWLRTVRLTGEQTKKLKERLDAGLYKARALASATHRKNKESRVAKIQSQVHADYKELNECSREMLEVALAMLYLGEGSKSKAELGLGNSDPMILRFYVAALKQLYGIAPRQFRIGLHLRFDQDEQLMKTYWSKAIGVPTSQFRYVIKDKRTIGRPTYEGYNGVCYVGGGGVEIQRRLMYLSEVFCRETSMRG